jgi:predicted permease
MGRVLATPEASFTVVEQAAAALSAVAARVAAQHGEATAAWGGAALQSLPETVLGDARPSLFLLAGAVGLLLLVACVNVANLYLARSTARGRELGVRTALGAGRGRLVRQLLAESALLSAAGGALGIVVAVTAVRLVQARAPDVLPRLGEVSPDVRVLAVSLGLVLGTTFLVGLAPAFRSAGRDVVAALRTGGAGSGVTRRTVRMRSALVVTQVALALVLVVGSGLLLRSLWRVQDVDLGFDADRVAVVRVFPPSPRYDDERSAAELYRQLREAAALVPGVTHAALANHMPMAGGWMPTRVIAGSEPPPQGKELALFRTVSPDYFAVVRVELLRGRLLDASDLAGPGGVVTLRRQELGIRVALGARRRQVGWMVTRHALRLAATGLITGLAASALATRYLRAQLFEVAAADPVTYAVAIALFTAVAIGAALVPAARAARTDPMEALRAER